MFMFGSCKISLFKLFASLVKLGIVLASTETLRRFATDIGDVIATLLALASGSEMGKKFAFKTISAGCLKQNN